MIVYCVYTIAGGVFGVKPLKQKLIIGIGVYETAEVYGMEKLEDNSDCVICLSNKRNTMVMPCKHICLCNECADVLSNNKSDCPICRIRIQEFSIIQGKWFNLINIA